MAFLLRRRVTRRGMGAVLSEPMLRSGLVGSISREVRTTAPASHENSQSPAAESRLGGFYLKRAFCARSDAGPVIRQRVPTPDASSSLSGAIRSARRCRGGGAMNASSEQVLTGELALPEPSAPRRGAEGRRAYTALSSQRLCWLPRAAACPRWLWPWRSWSP